MPYSLNYPPPQNILNWYIPNSTFLTDFSITCVSYPLSYQNKLTYTSLHIQFSLRKKKKKKRTMSIINLSIRKSNNWSKRFVFLIPSLNWSVLRCPNSRKRNDFSSSIYSDLPRVCWHRLFDMNSGNWYLSEKGKDSTQENLFPNSGQ